MRRVSSICLLIVLSGIIVMFFVMFLLPFPCVRYFIFWNTSKEHELPEVRTQEELPLHILLSSEHEQHYFDSNQYVHRSDNIKPDVRDKKNYMLHPEEQGERYDGRETDFLCDRLRNGERIEQRKAALALWTRFGGEDVTLPEDVRQAVSSAVRRYLRGAAAGDFEENFLQLQRLWHLAAPELLEHITDKDWQVSDCAARALSLMKTSRIIDRLQERAERATAPLDLKKCIFALKYLRIHNHVLVEGRPRLSQGESERIYRDRVQPQVERLSRLLRDMEQSSN